MKLRLAVVGTGYWGVNHVRAFARRPDVDLVAICDADAKALSRAATLAPSAKRVSGVAQVIADPAVDAVVLATPASQHARQALEALAAGKHVFVEKPMALGRTDADALCAAALRSGRTLMVGHLMLYHPAYQHLRALVKAGEIGDVYYLYSLRVNLGRLRSDENALWSFAPHDLSMVLDLLGVMPITVAARGEAYLQREIEDVVFVNLEFPGRVMAQLQLSWLDPRKERRLTVVGAKKMVEFDDNHPTEKLRLYDKGYDRPPTFTQYAEYLTVRHGDISIPRVDLTEPLELEAQHFVECVLTGAQPRSSAASGRDVVRVLEAAQESLRAGGAPVRLPMDLK